MHIGSCFSSFIQLDWSSGKLRALMQLSSQQFSKSDIHLFLLTGQQTVTSGQKVLSLKSSCGMRVSTAHVLQLQRQCKFLLNYKVDHKIFLLYILSIRNYCWIKSVIVANGVRYCLTRGISGSEYRWLSGFLSGASCQSTVQAGSAPLLICLGYHCQWMSPVHLLRSSFCWFSLLYMSLFYQGRSEMHGALWQLFKQPHLLSKGRCLQWSESCLFSSRRCFPPQVWAGTKMVFYQKHELGNLSSGVAIHTVSRHWRSGVCTCVCLYLTAVAKLSERCDNWSQMFESSSAVILGILLNIAESWLVKHIKM